MRTAVAALLAAAFAVTVALHARPTGDECIALGMAFGGVTGTVYVDQIWCQGQACRVEADVYWEEPSDGR